MSSTKLRPSAKEFVPGSKSKLRAQAAEFVPSPTTNPTPKTFLNGIGGGSSAKKTKEKKEDVTPKHSLALKIEDPKEAKDSSSPVEQETSVSTSNKGAKKGLQRLKVLKSPSGLTHDEEDKENENEEEEDLTKPSRKQSIEEETKAEQGLENSIKKSTYTREFILNLRDHASSPREKEIMDQIAKVLGKAATASPRTSARGRIDPRARGGRGQRGGKGASSRRGGGRRRPESPMDIEVKELEKSENRYVIKKDVPPDQQLIRSVTGILNKLTPEKFDRLLKQVLELKIDTSDRLRDTVTAVFEKALAEPDFSPIYAEFALHLSKKLAGFEVGQEAITFKRLLLNHCQNEFEKEAPSSPTEQDEPLEEGAISKTKRRMLATIRFIGELYARKMLSSSIIQYCITMLLGKVESPEEMKLDALCKLLATIGKVYDTEKNKTFLDQTFTTLQELVNKREELSSRSRFKLQDTLDLRDDDWVDRKQNLTQKKLSEIRKEASQKEEDPRRRYGGSPRKTPKTPLRQSPAVKNPEDEWETVGGGKGKRGRPEVRFDARRPPQFSPKKSSPGHSYRGETPKSRTNGRDTSSSSSSSSRATPNNKTPSSKQTPLAPGERAKVIASSANAFDLLDDDDEPKEFKSKKKPSKKATGPKRTEDDDDDDGSDKYRSTQDKLMSSAHDKTDTESSRTESRASKGDDDLESFDGDREKAEGKVKGLIEEFWSTSDLSEAVQSYDELPPKSGTILVSQGLFLASEKKKEEERDGLASLFNHLYQQKKLSQQVLEDGWREVLDLAEEMVLDIPKIIEHLGSIFGKLAAADTMSLNYLTPDCLTTMKNENKKKFIGEVLNSIKAEGGDDSLQTLYKDSDIDLEKIFNEDPESFLEDQDLAFLTSS